MTMDWNFLLYSVAILLVVTPFLFKKSSSFVYHSKFLVFQISTNMIMLFFIPISLISPRNIDNGRVTASVCKHVAKLIGIRYELLNPQILEEDRGAIIVCNHQSALDSLCMLHTWGTASNVAPVVKKELLYSFPFGLWAWLCGVVFIDRSNVASAYNSLREAEHLMKTRKAKIWIYPEGTRNKHAQKTRELLPFKKGAFKIAISCQAPIIPIVLSPYYFINENGPCFGEGTIKILTLEPISTEGLTESDVDEVMTRTRNLMQEAYNQLFKEVLEFLPKTHPFVVSRK